MTLSSGILGHEMKANMFLILVLWFTIASCAQSGPTENQINVISANIRVALKSDAAKGHGWEDRKENVFEVIKNQNPDIICLQEVLEVQNNDFKNSFPNYLSFGFEGPEMDAFTDGEYHLIAKNPILFNKEKFEFIGGGVYWLSEKPHIGGSISWGSARARHVNWVRLRSIQTGKVFRVLNTHLDHVSSEAKQNQAKMIVEESNQYPKDFPQILAGDFNSDSLSVPIQNLLTSWRDSYGILHNGIDPGFTVHGFKGPKAATKKGKVDFIFYRGALMPIEAKVIKDNQEGVYPSDHYFVSATMAFD